MSRADQRKAFSEETRMALLEGDVDALVATGENIRQEFISLRTVLEAKIDSLRMVLVGILISVATGAVLLAANIALGQ